MAFSIRLGQKTDESSRPVAFTEDAFREHMMIYGGTGQGKSKLLEQMLRQLLEHRTGFCLIDPHGDLAEDLLAYLARWPDRVSPYLRKNLVYLEPAHPEWCFSYDPFEYRGLAEDYDEWLESKVDSVAHAILRMQGEGDFPGTRLARWLQCVLTAAAVPVGDSGRHLSLADVQLLLRPHSRAAAS